MKASQHVLIAGLCERDRESMAAVFKALDMNVSWAPSFEVARRAVERAHGLALVVVDSRTSSEDAVALLVCVKNLQGRLPVLGLDFWFKTRVASDATADRYNAELANDGILFL